MFDVAPVLFCVVEQTDLVLQSLSQRGHLVLGVERYIQSCGQMGVSQEDLVRAVFVRGSILALGCARGSLGSGRQHLLISAMLRHIDCERAGSLGQSLLIF